MDDTTISHEVKIKIVKEFIEPAYIYDIKNMIRGKRRWKASGQIFETVSKILVAASGILSFSSGYYKDETLSFLAGSVSTISLAMLQFSSFCYRENKKQSDELNILLKKLGLDTIPVFDRNTEGTGLSKQMQDPTFAGQSPEENFKKVINDIQNRDEQVISYLNEHTKNSA